MFAAVGLLAIALQIAQQYRPKPFAATVNRSRIQMPPQDAEARLLQLRDLFSGSFQFSVHCIRS